MQVSKDKIKNARAFGDQFYLGKTCNFLLSQHLLQHFETLLDLQPYPDPDFVKGTMLVVLVYCNILCSIIFADDDANIAEQLLLSVHTLQSRSTTATGQSMHLHEQ